MSEKIIISLGGSLIVPDEIDTKFLADFKAVLAKFPDKEFVLKPGGGKTARRYGSALQALGSSDVSEADWLGIYAIRINALLLRFAFKDMKNVEVTETSDAKPGQTSDLHAVDCAEKNGSKVVINLSNIDYVYDKNPNEYKDAKPLEKVSWQDFQAIVGTEWKANQSWPFDPTASEKAAKLGLRVVFMNGKNLENLTNYLNGESFAGTVIS